MARWLAKSPVKIACWLVFCWGFVLALGDRFVRYVPTAKRPGVRRAWSLAGAHLLSVGLFAVSCGVTLVKVLRHRSDALDALGMLLFSGVYFPVDQMPAWLANIASALPLKHAIDIARPLMLGEIPSRIALHVAVLLAYAIAAYYVALLLTRRRLLK